MCYQALPHILSLPLLVQATTSVLIGQQQANNGNDELAVAAGAGGARDMSRLEPQVCLLFVFLLILHYSCLFRLCLIYIGQ